MSSLNVGTVTLSNGLTLPSYTSSPDNRPSHGAGKTIYDSTSDTIQVSDGTQWISAGSAGSGLVTATGGEITFAGGYKVHTWYNVGEYNFQVTGAASGANIEVLVVAGGGSGGTIGGGGGGGGVCYNGSFPVSVGSYDVKVGAGGSTPLSGYPVAKGTSGSPSKFGNHEAYGGGAAGSWGPNARETGEPGGSGGGATGPGPRAPTVGSATQGVAPGSGVTHGNPGYDNGNRVSGTHSGTHTGGGGGGANPNNTRNGRVGGDGITYMGLTVGGGGGGGSHENYGTAPIATPAAPGGGGRGASRSSQFAGGGGQGWGEPGQVNTGGGGGGGWYNGGGNGQGSAGGPGIVRVRHTV